MTERALTIALSKVLCKAARQNPNYCSHCEYGPCKKDMYETFTHEAESVIDHLKNGGLLKRNKLI